MKHNRWTECLLFVAIMANLVSCSVPTAATPVSTPVAVSATSFSDPFAYCTAAGTIDTPDARYVGPKVPDGIAKALQKATGAAPDAPLSIFQNSFWRCMNGKVYGCFVGANLPCTAKADLSRTPTTEETDFCKANPNAEVVPAVVTGRETVYEWRCVNGSPEPVRQVFQPDARGFLSAIWYELAPQ